MNPLFRLTGVRHAYDGSVLALADIDLTIDVGEQVAIIGANGSGKSTLLKMLDGLVFPAVGTVSAFDRRLTEEALEEEGFRRTFRSKVGFVFQESDVQLFCPTVFEELAFGPLQLGLAPGEVERRVLATADELGVRGLLGRPPYRLSGGEKKRVAIGSVLITEPEVLLLDEPTNALDPRSQVWLLGLLERLKQRGRTVVAATHDLSIVDDFADRVVVLSEEHEVVADGPCAEVLADRRLLLAANLIHEHAHRHGSVTHVHEHAHNHGHEHAHEPPTGLLTTQAPR